MHIHRSPAVQDTALTRTSLMRATASQNAAEVRQRLLDASLKDSGEDSFADYLTLHGSGEGTPRRQERPAGQAATGAKTAGVDEDEDGEPRIEAISFWS